MFTEEATWINGVILDLALSNGASAVDIGASDLFVRTRVQPHIHNLLYKPLLDRGIPVVSCDYREGLGVDHVVDICDKKRTPGESIGRTFDLVLCCNMLEHVVDRHTAMRNVFSLAREGACVVFTVPREYFYHEDPIDTMYRPTPGDLLELVGKHARYDVINQDVLSIAEREYYVMPVYPNILWHNIPFIAYRKLWRWLLPSFRWKVTCVAVRNLGVKRREEGI